MFYYIFYKIFFILLYILFIPNNNKNVINIYVVCKLDPISSTRNTDYSI